MTASLRSPESILFYLGAYVRAVDAVVTAELDGKCFGIPAAGDHVSMKVIAFLHQVFGLNKRATEPPAPGVVR